jgi:WD40 repeat protein
LDSDLALKRDDQDVVIWDANTWQKITTLKGHEGSITHAVFNPEGTRLITTSRDGSARIWVTKTGLGYKPLAGLERFIRDIVYSPDGVHVMARTGTTMRVWEAKTGKPVTTIKVHDTEQDLASDAVYDRDSIQLQYAREDVITSATFNQDSTHILTTSSDGSTYLWDIRTGSKVATFKEDNVGIWKGVFLKDDTRIVTGSVDSNVRIWDVAGQHKIATFKGSENNDLEWALFSPDGTRVAMIMKSGLVRVWDVQTQRVFLALDGLKEQRVTSVDISFDGSRLAIGFQDNSVNVWNLETGDMISTFKGHNGTVGTVNFSPDGTKIISGSDDRTARIWDIALRRQTALLKGHTNRIKRVRFNATGTRAISAGRDGSARMWDVKTGQELATFRHATEVKRNFINAAVFNPDQTQVATAATNIVRLWHIFPSTQSLIDYAKSSVPRCLTQEQRKTFFLDSDPPQWCFELGKWPNRREVQ